MKGFSLIELLIVLAVLAIIAVITFVSFANFKDAQVLRTSTDTVTSVLERARSRTLAGEHQQRFGVHFEENSIIMFPSDTYVVGHASNTAFTIDAPVRISSIDLDDGSSNVVFEQLTGDASTAGSVKLSLSTDPSSSSTVTITKTGIVEMD